MNNTIAIIGAGNIGQAIAQGLLDKKIVTHSQLILTDSKTKNNKEAVGKSDSIILAVKPQIMQSVLEEIKNDTNDNQLIISLAAGVTVDSIEKVLGENKHIIRVMPNIAAKVGESMSGWFATRNVTEEEKNAVRIILRAIGKEIELQKENEIDMITAISGSGPAYFFYLVELLENSTRSFGLSEEIGIILSHQILIGAAKLLKESKGTARELRMAVTSKGGTTEAAFSKLEKGNFSKLFEEAVLAAYLRAKQLKILQKKSDTLNI